MRLLLFVLFAALLPPCLAWGALPSPQAAPAASPTDSLQALLRQPGLPPLEYARISLELSYAAPNPAEALRYAEGATRAVRPLGQPGPLMQALHELTTAYRRADRPAAALRAARELLAVARRAHSARGEAFACDHLALINAEMSDNAAAERYYRQALAAVARADCPPNVRIAIFLSRAEFLLQLQEWTEAADFARQALTLAEERADPLTQARAHALLARVAVVRRAYTEAEAHTRQGVALLQAIPPEAVDPMMLAMLYQSWALADTATGQWTAAAQHSRLSQQYIKATGVVGDEVIALALIAAIEAHQGRYAGAYQAQRNLLRLNDTLFSERRTEQLRRLETQYQVREKQANIRSLTQRARIQRLEAAHQQANIRQLALGVVGLLTLLLVGGGLYGQLLRSRRRLATSEASLRQATQAKDRLYAMIGHDLRGPLAAFQELAQMMSFYRERGEVATMDEITREVSSTADQLSRLLDNLLHYAAAEAGELRCEPAPLSVAELMDEIAVLYTPAARARQVTLAVEAPAGLRVLADRTMTLMVLRNLTHNALKVAPPGTSVRLVGAGGKEQAGSPTVTLAVVDAGPGMPPDRVAALMSDALPATPVRRPIAEASGTGLGLPLVRLLARRQGGVFELRSTPGQGTTAAVTLPGAE